MRHTNSYETILLLFIPVHSGLYRPTDTFFWFKSNQKLDALLEEQQERRSPEPALVPTGLERVLLGQIRKLLLHVAG